MKENKGKVFYICFYADPEVEDKIIVYPSVISKIDYVVSCIKKNKKKTIVVSIAPSIRGKFCGFRKMIDDMEEHIYLKSKHSKNSLVKRIQYVLQNIRILMFLLTNVKKSDTVVVYHSLYNRIWLNLYKRLFRRNIILQIEDVFSALSQANKRFASSEWRLFRSMDKCLCVNDIIREELHEVPHTVISHGSYSTPQVFDAKQHRCCRLVYAGVIEQERKAAFLAVKAMKHLPSDYELHILGFGAEKSLSALKELIVEINTYKNYECVHFHGRMQGEQYFRFLQSCDIALSTHAYSEKDMASADFTFPSKVIVYLANNLRVVAQNLKVLKKSKIAKHISFYDLPKPEAIAEAIKNIDLKEEYDSRSTISKLDTQFVKDIGKLLGE